jgi:hypothetical protein
VQDRLDQLYGPQEDMLFLGKLQPVDVLMDEAYHVLIQTMNYLGHALDSSPYSFLKLNASHFLHSLV